MTHFHIPSADCRMCRLKSVPAHRKTGYPALLCVLQPPLDACRREGAFCFHAAAASAHLYYPPYIPNRSGSAPARILPDTYLPDRNPASQPVPGLHPVDERKIHAVSAFVKYQRLCPFSLDTMGCIAQNHNRHTFFPCAPQGQIDHRAAVCIDQIVMCLFSFPHRTVLWFDNCTMFRCAFQHAGGTHSRRTAKSAGGFSGDPRKNLPCLITVNQPRFSFSSVSIWASVFFVQIVDELGTDELQHLPHPLGKLHRSFPRICRSAKQCMLPEKPSSASRCWRTATRWKNHLLDAVNHGDADLAMQALQSFRGVTILGRKGHTKTTTVRFRAVA